MNRLRRQWHRQGGGQLLQEMQKAQQELQNQDAGQTPGAPNEAFQQALQNTQQVQPSTQVHNVRPRTTTTQAANVSIRPSSTAASPSHARSAGGRTASAAAWP